MVVNMEHADAAEAQRIRDFLRGAAYALGGDVRKVAARVYACVPDGVQIERLAGETHPAQPPAPLSAQGHVGEQDVWPE